MVVLKFLVMKQINLETMNVPRGRYILYQYRNKTTVELPLTFGTVRNSIYRNV